jgi:RNA polymerase sigma factor (sigma-70 family)
MLPTSLITTVKENPAQNPPSAAPLVSPASAKVVAIPVAASASPRGSRNNVYEKEAQLVEHYRRMAAQFGHRSEQASLAFKPIFKLYWPQVVKWAEQRVGIVHSEELAGETMFTVLERLNGTEEITYLRGLVRHSFEREYASLLEQLFQAKKLSRTRGRVQGQGKADPADKDNQPQALKGAVLLSLNQMVVSSSTEDETESINLLADESAEANVEQTVRRRELMQTLHQLIEQMPPQYREPLVCQWLKGMKIKEVCEVLDLTVDQVKHNTARGIKWLQKHLPGEAQDWLLN